MSRAQSLAMLTPKWMRYVLSDKTVDKFCTYAVNVLGVKPSEDKFSVAKAGIDATENFFRSIGMPMTLGELHIDGAKFGKWVEKAVEVGHLKETYLPLDKKDVVKILEMCR